MTYDSIQVNNVAGTGLEYTIRGLEGEGLERKTVDTMEADEVFIGEVRVTTGTTISAFGPDGIDVSLHEEGGEVHAVIET